MPLPGRAVSISPGLIREDHRNTDLPCDDLKAVMREDAQGIKKKVLFHCTHNSARSQMAEGLLRAYYGDRYEAYSAGVEAARVDPRAVLVMRELGIDISGQRSKSAEEFKDIVFDLAVTVCDRARQACPICSTGLEAPARSPRAREVIHRSFEDPAMAKGSEEEQLQVFRRVRDEIKGWIVQTFGG